ncbi:hypothetical protein ES705_31412 [subsurface metagenome]
MTRIVTGQDLIHKTELTYTPDRIWWSERSILADPTDIEVWSSTLIPNGSVVHEVQIQGESLDLAVGLGMRMVLSVVNSDLPTLAEVFEGERIVDWRWGKIGKHWYSVTSPTDEHWVMRKTLHGSHMRFGVSFETQNVGGCVCRVGVCYSPG